MHARLSLVKNVAQILFANNQPNLVGKVSSPAVYRAQCTPNNIKYCMRTKLIKPLCDHVGSFVVWLIADEKKGLNGSKRNDDDDDDDDKAG